MWKQVLAHAVASLMFEDAQTIKSEIVPQVTFIVVSRTVDRESGVEVTKPHERQAIDCMAQVERAADWSRVATSEVARLRSAQSKVARSDIVEAHQAKLRVAKLYRRCMMRS